MAKKTTSKKTAVKKAPATTAASKKTATKKPTTPKENMVVFAIRLTQAERDKIHATAGPRNATHFVRTVAAAFANEDVKAFQAVLKEARELRG